MTTDLDIIEAGVGHKDGCPVLRRVNAFLCQEGVPATLRHVVRDRQGNPVSFFTEFVDLPASESALPISESAAAGDVAVLAKFQEFLALNFNACVPLPVAGTVFAGHEGVVDVPLPQAVYGQSGLYRVSFGILRNTRLLYVSNALVSVERTLFGFDTPAWAHTAGPPTINEVRMQMMDSDPAENNLLQDVEFSDEQIATALAKPIQDFEEALPPLSVHFDTRDFPWKSAWLDATVGYLYQFAAANYRRNRLQITGGNKSLDDKAKEPEYLKAAQLHISNWKSFVLQKKCQINLAACVGSVGSVYGRGSGGF